MQYRITLPADYDMAIIRRRIAERGHLTDALAQLAFKAYLYADRQAPYAAGGANRYAPFYLWRAADGMNAFLGGAGFAGLTASFGRPSVHMGSAWHAQMAADLSAATHATCETVPLRENASPAALCEVECTLAQGDAERGALAAVSAFEPRGWTALRMRLWREMPGVSSEHVDVYQVGHVSQPSA